VRKHYIKVTITYNLKQLRHCPSYNVHDVYNTVYTNNVKNEFLAPLANCRPVGKRNVKRNTKSKNKNYILTTRKKKRRRNKFVQLLIKGAGFRYPVEVETFLPTPTLKPNLTSNKRPSYRILMTYSKLKCPAHKTYDTFHSRMCGVTPSAYTIFVSSCVRIALCVYIRNYQ
jgi:hypothetical protein